MEATDMETTLLMGSGNVTKKLFDFVLL